MAHPRLLAQLLAVALLAAAGAGARPQAAAGARDAAGAGRPRSVIPSTTLRPNPSAARLLGVTLHWSRGWLSDLDAYAAGVGRMPSVVQTFRDMESGLLDPAEMRAIAARGATPLVTVEPWDGTDGSDPRYTLARIAGGAFDDWFAAGAKASRAYGEPYYLRFAPEMNGAWTPWGAGVNGNTPRDYVHAWRHVRRIFAVHGATNAIWVWAPNTLGGAADFRPYFPGSDEVDVLGLDGYNWGSFDVWQSYSQVFGRSYDELCTLDPVKPVIIAETASTERGGDKAAWIASAYRSEIAARTPRVKIVVWFNLDKETDWRVGSSAASLRAFRAVARSASWG